MIKARILSIFVLLVGFSSQGSAEETEANTSLVKKDSQVITIETAVIRGNQELPTVLYLVPWQAPEINALAETQTTDILKKDIELIDRNSFRRLIQYHKSFN